MTVYEREKKAKELGVFYDIGKKVISSKSFLRAGETATIIGWGLTYNCKEPVYYIQFENGEGYTIPAGNLFYEAGFSFAQ